MHTWTWRLRCHCKLASHTHTNKQTQTYIHIPRMIPKWRWYEMVSRQHGTIFEMQNPCLSLHICTTNNCQVIVMNVARRKSTPRISILKALGSNNSCLHLLRLKPISVLILHSDKWNSGWWFEKNSNGTGGIMMTSHITTYYKNPYFFLNVIDQETQFFKQRFKS